MWEPLFGIRGKFLFFRKPYLVSFPSLSFLNLCKGLWPPSSPVMPEDCHPSSLARAVMPPRRRGLWRSLAWPEVWVCKLGVEACRENSLSLGAW